MEKDNTAKLRELPETRPDVTELDEAALDDVNGGFIGSSINQATGISGMKPGANKPGFLGGAAGNAVKSVGEGLSQTTRK